MLFSQSLLKGSPSYKRRRRKASRSKRQRSRGSTAGTQYGSANEDSGSDSDIARITSYGAPFASVERHPHPDRYAEFASNLLVPANAHTPPRAVPALPAQGDEQSTWSNPLSHEPGTFCARPAENAFPASSLSIGAESNNEEQVAVPGTLPLQSAGKGFSCPLLSCGRMFKRLEHLKRHVRTHTQERPYECTRCSKRFSRSDNLTQHVKTHEKADRGERMKTEASETTEDEVVRYLEAEVDAMAAREMRGYSMAGSMGGDLGGRGETYPAQFGMSRFLARYRADFQMSISSLHALSTLNISAT